MSLDRYRAFIPGWEEFREISRVPEPTYVRVRAGRIVPGRLRVRLEAQGFALEPIPSLGLSPDEGRGEEDGGRFFRVKSQPFPVTDTLEHWHGFIYVQQAVTGLAALALDPRPGERILDMCAAPGGKTTHVADIVEARAGRVSGSRDMDAGGGGDGGRERGTIVAADAQEGRLRGLLGNVYRLGHTGVMVLRADGREFPGGALFDRVLVDAPCSGEGTLRQKEGELEEQSADFLDYVTGLQEKLLRRAVALTRPGGVVLYVTCTFNPDENEAVVSRLVEETPVRLEQIPLDVPHEPGLTEFEGESFGPALRRAWRVYPHHLDSGGLFMARLRKEEGEEAADGWSPVPELYPGDDLAPKEAADRISEAQRQLGAEYGVREESVESLGWMVRGKSVWAHTLGAWPLKAWEPKGSWRFVCLGLRAFKRERRFGLRPTNDFLRRVGPALEGRRVVDVSRDEFLRTLEGEWIPVPGAPNGNVALRVEDPRPGEPGEVLGRGIVRDERARPEISKSRRSRITDILRGRRSQ